MRLAHSFLPAGPRTASIPLGINRGSTMRLDFSCDLQRYAGLSEREVAPWFRRLGRDIRTAIDVGAADGWYTLYFLAKTRAERVIAYEPSDESVQLAQNVLLNHDTESAKRLTIIRQFVGGGQGTVQLDDLGMLPLPCLIKVDVEGAEVDVLDGAQRLVAQAGVRWIIETHSAKNEAVCAGRLMDAGYRTEIVYNAWWRVAIPERRPLAHNRWLVAWHPSLA